jgi:hypothetical protein
MNDTRYSIDDILRNSPMQRALSDFEPDGSPIGRVESEPNQQVQTTFSNQVPPKAFSSGEILGNVTMQDGYLKSGNYEQGVSGWKLFANGVIEAVNAVINGTITAVSGVIGGFTVTATELYGGIIKTAATVQAGSTGVIMDTDGLRGYDAVLGQTFNLPTDGSAPSFSSGVINTTTFEIDTSGIMRTSATVGDGSSSSEGILINSTGIYVCAANQTLSNANIKILSNGEGTFTASIKGGATDFFTGIGYFLGLSSGEYKFSIGNPSTSYMKWDGTNLVIKGSFDVGSNGVINNSVYTVATLPIAATTVGFNPPSAFE